MQEPVAAVPAVTILVLAAGASSRMRGQDKLLETVQGMPLLRKIAKHAAGTGMPVVVAISDERPRRAAALDGLAVQRLYVPARADGMAASLRAGVLAVPPDHAVLVLLADMPEIDTADLATMIAAYRLAPQAVHRACADDGTAGHPVVFPPWARPELLGITGDMGARTILQAHAASVRLVALPASHALTDLDTPEDWAEWRARQTRA